jgi:hypothetical protein
LARHTADSSASLRNDKQKRATSSTPMRILA